MISEYYWYSYCDSRYIRIYIYFREFDKNKTKKQFHLSVHVIIKVIFMLCIFSRIFEKREF